MKKRSHKNTSRLTARERAVFIARTCAFTGSVAAIIERAIQGHARATLVRDKRRRSARLSKRTLGAIANARAKPGVARDYLDDAIVELAKGMPL